MNAFNASTGSSNNNSENKYNTPFMKGKSWFTTIREYNISTLYNIGIAMVVPLFLKYVIASPFNFRFHSI